MGANQSPYRGKVTAAIAAGAYEDVTFTFEDPFSVDNLELGGVSAGAATISDLGVIINANGQDLFDGQELRVSTFRPTSMRDSLFPFNTPIPAGQGRPFKLRIYNRHAADAITVHVALICRPRS